MDSQHRILAGEVSILESIARGAPLDTILATICHFVEELSREAIAGVTVIDRSARSFEKAVVPRLPTYAAAIPGLDVGPPHVGTCAAAVYRGEPIRSQDVAEDARFSEGWRSLNLRHDIHSVHSVPALASDGTPLGSFFIGLSEARTASAWENELTEIGARLAGLALERYRAREKQQLMIGELEHRAKNLLASMRSIVRMSLKGRSISDTDFAAVDARLLALAKAHSLSAAHADADLREVVTEILAPYGDESIEIDGPPMRLKSEAVVALSMALHELATNAAKYGALSVAGGRVRFSWGVDRRESDEDRISMWWAESGGPPVSPPTRQGFGIRVIERSLAQQFEAEVRLDFAAEGVCCEFNVPIGHILEIADRLDQYAVL